MPDNSADLIVTDPPYYDLVPYADLSDFFYVWLKKMLKDVHPHYFDSILTPKENEIVQLAERNQKYSYKSKENYQRLMTLAMRECHRITTPKGLSVVFFAHKGTSAWEAQLQSMIDARWVITASWPIATELATRMRGMNSAVLGSTICLVCRPKKTPSDLKEKDNSGACRAAPSYT
jgi:adenine-specific DNA methylase